MKFQGLQWTLQAGWDTQLIRTNLACMKIEPKDDMLDEESKASVLKHYSSVYVIELICYRVLRY